MDKGSNVKVEESWRVDCEKWWSAERMEKTGSELTAREEKGTKLQLEAWAVENSRFQGNPEVRLKATKTRQGLKLMAKGQISQCGSDTKRSNRIRLVH